MDKDSKEKTVFFFYAAKDCDHKIQTVQRVKVKIEERERESKKHSGRSEKKPRQQC